MNTVLLQYAVEVEKTGSITQAAANLYMDQPNLSKAIKTLEESLGAPIFRRTSKGVVPTARGRIFLEHARNVLDQIEMMEHLYKPDEVSGVEFSLSMPRASYLSLAFSRFIQSLCREEGMNVWLRETNSADTLKDVETREYNLGIIRYQSSLEGHYAQTAAAKGLLMVPVLEYSLRLLMSADHPLAGKEEITGEDLMPYIEIVHGDGALGRRDNFEKKGRPLESPKRVYVFERGSQFNLLLEDPHTYMWVSPMPEELLKRYGLVERQCRKKAGTFRDVLIYRKGYSFSAWDKGFLNELEAVKNIFLE
ncbi:MAG: LysR family transcriptional regulator [Hungatella sp.]|nr:LysR family transcriptional regulator [Hungatella sp.]